MVANLGTGPLQPISPITTPVGNVVTYVGSGVSAISPSLTDQLSSGRVEKITQTGSNAIVPLTSAASSLTQTVAGVTGLGVPVDGLLGKVGGGLDSTGQQISGDSALRTSVGSLVSSTGQTVSAAGVLLNNREGTNNNLISGLTNSLGNLNEGNPTVSLGGISASVQATVNVFFLGGGTRQQLESHLPLCQPLCRT